MTEHKALLGCGRRGFFCNTYAASINDCPDCRRNSPSICKPAQLYRKDLAQFERNARASTLKHATGAAAQGDAASNAGPASAPGRPVDASSAVEGASKGATAEKVAAKGVAAGDAPAAAEEASGEEAPGEDAEVEEEGEYDEFEDEYHDEDEDEGASADKRPKLL